MELCISHIDRANSLACSISVHYGYPARDWVCMVVESEEVEASWHEFFDKSRLGVARCLCPCKVDASCTGNGVTVEGAQLGCLSCGGLVKISAACILREGWNPLAAWPCCVQRVDCTIVIFYYIPIDWTFVREGMNVRCSMMRICTTWPLKLLRTDHCGPATLLPKGESRGNAKITVKNLVLE